MRKRISIFVVLAVVVMFGTMIACGGGGGTSLNESVNYSGVTQPAVIDTTSAVQFALNATIGTKDSDEYGGGVTPLSLSGPGSEGGLSLVQHPGQAIEMMRSFIDLEESPQLLGVSLDPLRIECDTLLLGTGSVGGTISLKLCADPQDYYTSSRYWISGTFIFDEYDNGTDYQDGQLGVQGIFDEDIGIEGDFDGPVTVIFRDLVTIDSFSGENSYIDGWAVYQEGSGDVSITYNMCIIDSISGDAYWMDDYVIAVDHVNDEVTLSGRFYDSDAGYVDLTTETVLSWDIDISGEGELVWNSDHPTAGTVKMTGANGFWISITFSPTGFIVQINFTGDDTPDAVIGEIPWIT